MSKVYHGERPGKSDFQSAVYADFEPSTSRYILRAESKDGTIHVICTTGVRDTVVLVSFKEGAILGNSK